MLLGITGMPGSGKDTAADFLRVWRGLTTISLSDILRQELKAEGKGITTQELIDYGNKLRQEHGPGVLGERAIVQISPDKNGVITSIRNPGEVLALMKRKDFVLVNIHADDQVRYSRLESRKREGETKLTYEQFMEIDRQQNSTNPSSLQMQKVIENATYTITNNGTLQELHKALDSFLRTHGKQHAIQRPDWDSYYLAMCSHIAARATCDRGRAGCVITLDNRILTTGYVGSPPGIPHCDEVGHEMQQVSYEDGTSTWHCVRTTHAEQNAIAQASKHGIKLQGATLYCKMTPCFRCANEIVSAGLKRVIVEKRYQAAAKSHETFKQAGVELIVKLDEVETYSVQTKPK